MYCKDRQIVNIYVGFLIFHGISTFVGYLIAKSIFLEEQ